MFQIPEDKLPDCLKDEQRINVLFAPLRNRSVNPKDWDSKLSSWKSIIKIYCYTNNIYTFSVLQLKSVFIRNGRPPSCLNEVVNDMLKDGEIQLIDVFMTKTSTTWSGWAIDILVKRPLSWSFNKVKDKIISPSSDQTFVHVEIIKIKCESLLAVIPDKFKNKLISLKQLLFLLQDSLLVNNVKLLLHYLQNEHKIDITELENSYKEEPDRILIKFGDGSKVVLISERDIGIYMLEQNEQQLSKSIEILEDEILTCIKEAKVQLLKNHKQSAKSFLRKKHELEKRVDKKMNALHNIQILLEQMHETHNDAHVWEAYKKALKAYDTTFKDTGLSESAIEDTMIKLGEVLDKHHEIQEALAKPAQDDFSDLDLEEELAQLLEDDSKNPTPPNDGNKTIDLEKEIEKLALSLPEVPDCSPNVSTHEIIGT